MGLLRGEYLPETALSMFVAPWLFSFGPRGAGIRRLTSRQKIQGNQYQKERPIRHTGQSGHGSGDSGPRWLAHPRPENHAEEKSSHPQRRGPRRQFYHSPRSRISRSDRKWQQTLEGKHLKHCGDGGEVFVEAISFSSEMKSFS